MKPVGLVSRETKPIVWKGKSYPFSYSTVLYSLKRVLQRKEHSTLTCDDQVKAVHVVVFFLKLYQGFEPSPAALAQHGIEHVVALPFTPTLDSIPAELLDAFHQVLDNTRT
jgi:hypothetical protein